MKISKEATIGLLVVVAVTIFIWGINFLKGNSIFSTEQVFYAKYQRVDGLKKSSPVTLKGFKIGQIKSINFNESNINDLIVSFSVGNEFHLPKNTTVRIVSSDIMGTKEIQINPGDSKEILQAGDTISGSIEGDLKEQVSMQMLPLKNKAERLMSSVDSVLTVIQYIFNADARDNISQSLSNIKNAIDNLENTSGNLDTLVSGQRSHMEKILSNVESITSNLDSNGENISKILNNFSSISDSLKQAEITSTVNNANAALAQLNEIFQQINSGKGSMGAFLKNDSLYFHMESASKHLDELLIDLKDHPKRYVHLSVFGRKDKRKK
ncbi:MCE family protein [Ancylomarina salipaludis]|uniref:MCE family protein n=1 Tax=Ancylomarina salipaludis TaxID=2501299 RepID=A0A4Q1JKV0_9BACT|nr:MlaD family protein [Ancylomarina salipaludis]RXQ91567.1 MCE family protein [Ancylomarina salipaludis]